MKKNNIKAVLFTILTVSAFALDSHACQAHNRLRSRTVTLPGNSVYHLNGKWVNQDNTTVSFQNLQGRPRLIAMVYTKCPTSCPMLVQDIKSTLSGISHSVGKDLHVDLFSFDSENETAETLRKFRQKYRMDDNWSAYTGSQGSVSELAAVLGIQYKRLPSGDFIHQNVMFLLSDKGEIIAKQEGFKSDPADFRQKIEKVLQQGGLSENKSDN